MDTAAREREVEERLQKEQEKLQRQLDEPKLERRPRERRGCLPLRGSRPGGGGPSLGRPWDIGVAVPGGHLLAFSAHGLGRLGRCGVWDSCSGCGDVPGPPDL